MNSKRLRQILAKFPQQRLLVVGDVMLDQFLWGKVSRISPEAPVPVVDITRESFFPGGAANVARNLRALDSSVGILGVVGDDDAGAELRGLLEQQGVDTHGLIADPNRPTTVKTRIVAHHQQVVRFDREKCIGLSAALERKVLEYFESHLKSVTAVVFRGLRERRALTKVAQYPAAKSAVSAEDYRR